MKAHTFVTWKFCRIGFTRLGKNFWQVRLGVVIISRMPADSMAVKNWIANKGAA